MNNDEQDTPDLDNSVMRPEEIMFLFPWPVHLVAQLCREIQDEQDEGYY